MSMIKAADLTSQDYLRDPSALVDRLLGEGGIASTKLPMFGQMWMIDGYQGRTSLVQLRRNPNCACCGRPANTR